MELHYGLNYVKNVHNVAQTLNVTPNVRIMVGVTVIKFVNVQRVTWVSIVAQRFATHSAWTVGTVHHQAFAVAHLASKGAIVRVVFAARSALMEENVFRKTHVIVQKATMDYTVNTLSVSSHAWMEESVKASTSAGAPVASVVIIVRLEDGYLNEALVHVLVNMEPVMLIILVSVMLDGTAGCVIIVSNFMLLKSFL